MRNHLKAVVRAGSKAVGSVVTIGHSFNAEIIAAAGFDFLILDLQHGLLDYASMVGCIQSLGKARVTVLVRLPLDDGGLAARALDAGAHGVITPSVDDTEAAAATVRISKYPPMGARSNGPIRPYLYEGGAYQLDANAETLNILMIESLQGIEAMRDMAGLVGVDGLYFGTSDLKMALGLRTDTDISSPAFAPVQEQLIDGIKTCREAGLMSCVHCSTTEEAKFYFGIGFDVVSISNDCEVLKNGMERLQATIAQYQRPQ